MASSRSKRPSSQARLLHFESLEDRRLLTAAGLDPGFADDGQLVIDFFGRLDFARALALQDDGMIVVAGEAGYLENIFQPRTAITLVRLTEEGWFDEQFGDQGVLLLPVDGFTGGTAHQVVLQPDQKILVAGELHPGVAVLARLNSDGSPDEQFADGGFYFSEISSSANEVVIQPDGKIVVVGDAEGPLGYQIFLARFLDDGSPDPSFGEEGVQITNLLVPHGSATAIALQEDGQIVVAGHVATDEPELSRFLVARFDGDDGSLDESFGAGGIVTTTVSGNSVATDVTVREDGILVAGSDDGALLIAGYTSAGDPDPGWDDDGILIEPDLNPVPGGTTGAKMAIQNGKLLITASGGNDFVVLRYLGDGSPDTSFENDGRIITDLDTTFNSSVDLVAQPDGKYVVAGISGGNWGIVRYLGDSIPANETPWQNPIDPHDVDADGSVAPIDVLTIINELNAPTTVDPDQRLPPQRPADAPYFDVDGNQFVTPLDALLLIDFLNESAGPEGEPATFRAQSNDLAGLWQMLAVDVEQARIRRRRQ